ncbi:hypothetical protein GCM10027067_25910 [Pseudactinotalea suaedae]
MIPSHMDHPFRRTRSPDLDVPIVLSGPASVSNLPPRHQHDCSRPACVTDGAGAGLIRDNRSLVALP